MQSCLQYACTDTADLAQAKAAFRTECLAAGIRVNFNTQPGEHLDMVRRADASAKASNTARASATGTAKGPKPAAYTGAAAPREIAGKVLGFVAAAAAAAAI